ncbi:TPA: DUF4406 domain-containing protein [Escherichia coli]
MKVYIAGPMSGLPNFNRAAFNHAHFHLWSKGHIVLNPARLPDGLTQAEYMDICLSMLRCADAIYMLEGWEHSAGARAEKALAEKLEMEIIFQEEDRAA